MAVNFPDNPSINDEFVSGERRWVWDGNVWLLKQRVLSRFIVSENPPTDPVEGDGWFNSTTSKQYIYYDSYWVEVVNEQGETGVVSAISPLLYNAETQTLSIDQNAITSTIISETAPTSPVEGTRWLKSTTWQEFVYYNNEWIELI